MNRTHAADSAKLVLSWTAFFTAINWNSVAAFLTCVFTLLLIIDKIGLLAPMKAACLRAYANFKAKQRGQGGV